MDFLQDYLPGLQNLQNVPLLFNLYNTYYRPYEPYLRPFRKYLYTLHRYSYRYLYPSIWPVWRYYIWPAYRFSNQLLGKVLTDTPDLASLALLALMLIVSLKVMGIMRRMVAYWLALAVKMAVWGLVAAVGAYVWQRGLEGSMEDVGWLFGVLSGEVEEVGRSSRAAGAGGSGPRRGHGANKAGAGKGPRGRTRGGGWG